MNTNSTENSTILTGESINLALREHQVAAPGWNYRDRAAELHVWAERFILEFKFQVPVPSLTVEPLRRRYGHFRYGRNGFGLLDEIALDSRYVQCAAQALILDTLLHELLHSWQNRHGRPGRRNYHNREFRAKALSLGLEIDSRGCGRHLAEDTPFVLLLRRYGIEAPASQDKPRHLSFGAGSKLRLFICQCGVRVRVGRATFNAKCLECNGQFELEN